MPSLFILFTNTQSHELLKPNRICARVHQWRERRSVHAAAPTNVA
jgi:hypothetical protein